MQIEIHSWFARVFCESTSLCDMETYQEIVGLAEVAKCPAHVPADYSSNLAFVTQKRRSERAEDVFSIQILAEELIRDLSKIEQGYLKFFPSEFGHINIQLTEYAKTRFLQKLSELAAEDFFSRRSLLFPEIVLVEVEKQKFLIQASVLLAQARESEDRELKEFVDKLRSAGEYAQDDLFMLLAAYSDCELELRAYRQGLAGKQNIPWYFSRFKADLLKFIAKAKKQLGSKELEKSEILHLPQPAEQALEHLLSYRGVYFNSLRGDKPEVFFAFLISCMHSFYQFYNRPEIRSLELPLEAIAELRSLSKSLYNVVAQGFSHFQFEYSKDR